MLDEKLNKTRKMVEALRNDLEKLHIAIIEAQQEEEDQYWNVLTIPEAAEAMLISELEVEQQYHVIIRDGVPHVRIHISDLILM